MHLELLVSNDPRALPSVTAFVHTTLLQFALPEETAEQLQRLICAAAASAVEHAYPSGEDGSIRLSISEKAGQLEIRVRDFGLPQDVALLEQQLHVKSSDISGLHAADAAGAVDELHWLGFGPQGKALQLIKWLPTANIADTAAAEELSPVADDVPPAPQQQYTVRRMRPEEAVQVSQLMYRTYGNTYFNEDVYYPQRIAAQNEHQVLISVVAAAQDGRLAGHCALECNQPGPVAELGQAAVDPAHRGRGLLDRMKEALEGEAKSLQLAGWFADAVAVHTFTQQSNAHHGGHVCGIDLAVSPETEAFRNIAGQQPQRVSCVLYFHWLTQPQLRTVFVPPQHQEIVAAIYENLQCPVEFGQAGSPPPQQHGTLAVKMESGAALATIRAEQIGQDTALTIRHSIRQLVERSRAEAVVVELPLADAATADICQLLEADGLAFTGIGPHFSPHGDVLKLAYLVKPLAKEPIKSFEPFAGRLVEYALAEQKRVRANL